MKTLVVVTHPREDSLTRAAFAQVTAGLEAAGSEFRILDLDAEGFDPLLSRAEKLDHQGGPDNRPSLSHHFDALNWCERVVLVYPTWFGGQPAMLKGWFDRVWMNEVAFHLPEGATRIHAKLKNVKRLEIVTSHGSSRLLNLVQGNPGRITVFRTLRVLCHPLCRNRLTAIYNIDRATPDEIEAWLNSVKKRYS